MTLRLLTDPTSQPKAIKGMKVLVYTTVLHLTPADGLGVLFANLCPWATAECRAVCLHTAGHGGITRADGTNGVRDARARKTREYHADRAAFMARLVRELEAHVRGAARRGMTGAVRLNATSDVVWERKHPCTRQGVEYASLFDAFPELTFYDYTKSVARVELALTGRRPLPANYSLTYSFTGTDESRAAARRILELGGNVSVVFDTRKGAELPATWEGAPVVDGDVTDVRFSDPAGHVVGLRAKGDAVGAAVGGFIQSGSAPLRALPMAAA